MLVTTLLSSLLVAIGPVTWQFGTDVAPNGQLRLELVAQCEPGWHIYALTLPREDGPLPTVFRVPPSAAYAPAGPVEEPTPLEVHDPNFAMLVRYHADRAVFTLPLQRLSAEAFTVEGEVEYMVCNDQTCLPPVTVPFSVHVPAR